MYQYIFFDLDGTLTDPREGITKSVQYALAKMGIDEPDLKKLEPFIGPPLVDSLMEYYDFTMEQAKKGVEYYREYFKPKGLFQNAVFEGAPKLLASLKAHGRTVAIASSKPEPFVEQILDHFQIRQYFDYVCGSTLDETRTKKEEVIEELLRRIGISDEEKKKVLMVGDRKHDVEGAACFGIPCLGVRMGFAAEGELEAAGAIAIADSMAEVEKFILEN